MPIVNNYWKMLLGNNAQVLVAGAVAYTAQATYAAFLANAAQGELGVFDNTTLGLVAGGGAASLTQNLFISVMRDGAPERTTSFQIGQLGYLNRTAYSAPVKQISTVTLGVFGSLVLQDITYKAINKGAAGNAVTIANVVAGNNTALSVAVVGNAITVNEATNGGGAATSTAAQIQAAVAASAPASALVVATVTGTAATVQTAAGATNLAGGASPAIVAGQTFDIALLETTPGYQPMPTYEYVYTSVTGDAVDTIANNLVNQLNQKTSIANANRDLIVSAAYNATTGVITITALNFGVSFRVLVKYDLAGIAGGTIAYGTPMHLGSGFTQQVQLIQDAGDIYKGVTTNYPMQGSNPADYGKPSDMTIAAMGYNIYVFSGYGAEGTRTPGNKQIFLHRNIFLCVPTSGTTPEVQVKAIFGL